MSRMGNGIRTVHQRRCRSRQARRCNCTPSYEASAWNNDLRKRHTRTFPSFDAARNWRHNIVVAIRRREAVGPYLGVIVAPVEDDEQDAPPTVAQALDA